MMGIVNQKESVNFVSHLLGAFTTIRNQKKLNPIAVALYFALFDKWNKERFPLSFKVNRREILAFSKCGKNSYTKGLYCLQDAGLLTYNPGKNGDIAATIVMKRLDANRLSSVHEDHKGAATSLNQTNCSPVIGLSVVPDLVPNIKRENNKQIKTNIAFLEKINDDQETNLAAAVPQWRQTNFKVPSNKETEEFFSSHGFPLKIAEDFYQYNNIRGWKFSKNSGDWKYYASVWMQRNPSFKNVVTNVNNEMHTLQSLYNSFQKKEDIFSRIKSYHLASLNLEITPYILASTYKQRLKDLMTSNKRPNVLLMEAYKAGNNTSELVIKDKPYFNLLANKIALLFYFNNLLQQGIKTIPSSIK